MSWEAMIWAHKLRIGLTPAHYRTLMVLADHANKGSHIAYPSIATIATEAELSEKSVQRALDELIEKGVVRSLSGDRSTLKGGRALTGKYRLMVSLTIDAKVEKGDGETPTFCPEGSRKPRHSVQETPTFCPENPVRMSPEPKTEPKTEPSTGQPPLFPDPPPAPKATKPAAPKPKHFDEWWARYPRKVGKGEAEKAYAKAVASGASERDLYRGLLTCEWSDDPEYIPHPGTWLNKKRWLDEPTKRPDAPGPLGSNL